jgi:ubiquinol-cytochrome c reductase cytochrome b/c1 subunit
MYPYYIIKDWYGIIIFLIFFSFFLFFIPNYLGHTDNYIPANPLVTPTHIVPEWYFSPFYAILRSIPDKLFGVIAMLGSILVLFTLPYFYKFEVRSLLFRPLSRFFFWFFTFICILLGWLGSMPASEPFVSISQFITFCYFGCFFFYLPLLYLIEVFFWRNPFYLLKING